MRKLNHNARSAPIAIAAMLALGSTPTLAQEAQGPVIPGGTPPLVLPVDPAPQTAPPTTTTQSTTTSPNASQSQTVANPVVQQLPVEATPVESEPAAAEAAASTAATTQPRTTTAPAERQSAPAPAPAAVSERTAPPAASAPSVQSEVADDAAVVPALPDTFAEPAPVTAAETPPAVSTDSGLVSLIALALAGLIPLAAVIFAIVWWRRQSRRVKPEVIERPVVKAAPPAPERKATVDSRLSAGRAAPVMAASRPTPVSPAPVIDREPVVQNDTPLPVIQHEPTDESELVDAMPASGPAPAPAPAASGAQMDLPRNPPATREGRMALLRKMVAAKPDKANPFRSLKARRRRARLILQSLGRSFENAKPRIDLSQYTHIWPSLARHRYSPA